MITAYFSIMELSYSELRKRDVINISDGRCLGRIIDLRMCFPEGVLIGIVVPGRKTHGIFRVFDKSELYIDESRIIKIGGDVILVDINCGDLCSSGVRINKADVKTKNNNKNCIDDCLPNPCPPCPPKHPPKKPCPPQPPHHEQCSGNSGCYVNQPNFNILSGGAYDTDVEDY